ncbi:hypothetical protein Nepgr_030526 [Nepenthes gracilis]|uniref:C2H2-type domain-containing protein n=1 Tax=Nepenthes gracilis TaxID=150966 RepID=A0AAD3TEZ7_NEPGR|nr:hypothetical protein Nepgr_030526 [Nepenthes gracilis]
MNFSGDYGFPLPPSVRGFAQREDQNPYPKPHTNPAIKKRRNLPGTPDPDAEVIALSPKTLMATNRFICEICNKGFQRDQNLQLHRRGHNLPWKLRQRTNKEVKQKVYICPETTCIHHEPSRALGDLTGIKKHFSRKHGEKKWKCEKCSKKYAVQSDWKAHTKTCGTREYKCDCGTLFSRKDSFITHRAFCDALAEESAKFTSAAAPPSSLSFKNDPSNKNIINQQHDFLHGLLTGGQGLPDAARTQPFNPFFGIDFTGTEAGNPLGAGMPNQTVQMASSNVFGSTPTPNFESNGQFPLLDQCATSSTRATTRSSNAVETLASSYSSDHRQHHHHNQSSYPRAPMSATALLQKAAQLGSTRSSRSIVGSRFGITTTSSSSINNSSSTNMSRDRLQQVLEAPSQAENLTASSPLIGRRPILGSSVATAVNDLDQLVTLRKLPTVPAQLKLHQSSNQVINGELRDFLGVGARHGGRPFMPLEIAGFPHLLPSTMGLSHFSR